MPQNPTKLECSDLSKAFGLRTILRDLNLSVPAGERLALIGISGAGKTTLLRIIAGLEPSSSGQVLIDASCPVPGGDTRVSMVFQRSSVYPHMSVRDNLAFPLAAQRASKSMIAQRVAALTEALGLHGVLDQKAAKLSGGEAQRVALGKAIASPPQLLLLDEPFANLHQSLRWNLVDYVRRIHAEYKLTTLLVTHEPADALYFGQRIAVLTEGRIAQLAEPSRLLSKPAHLDVALLLFAPSANVIRVNRLVRLPENRNTYEFAHGDRTCSLVLPSAPPEDSLILVWRPQDTGIGPCDDEACESVPGLHLKGVVLDTTTVDTFLLTAVDVGGTVIRASQKTGNVVPKRNVSLSIHVKHLHCFDTNTRQRIALANP